MLVGLCGEAFFRAWLSASIVAMPARRVEYRRRAVARLAGKCHVDKEKQANLHFAQEIERNQMHGYAEPMARAPTQAHAAPEGAQILPSVNLVGDQQRTPFGPEEMDLRGNTQGRTLFLGA